jgi:aldose 1-epimerase
VFQAVQGGVKHSAQPTPAQCCWQVTHSTQYAAKLACRHVADATFPFNFEAVQTFELKSGALNMRLSVTNRSATPAPLDLAWRAHFLKREGSHLAFEATRQWDAVCNTSLDGGESSTGLNTRCAALGLERCFSGWPGELYLRDEEVLVRVSSGLSCLLISSQPERDQIAIEPVNAANTSMPRATLNPDKCLELGFPTLSPGAALAYEVHIEAQRMP